MWHIKIDSLTALWIIWGQDDEKNSGAFKAHPVGTVLNVSHLVAFIRVITANSPENFKPEPGAANKSKMAAVHLQGRKKTSQKCQITEKIPNLNDSKSQTNGPIITKLGLNFIAEMSSYYSNLLGKRYPDPISAQKPQIYALPPKKQPTRNLPAL